MLINKLHQTLGAVAAALFLVTLVPQAQAGPSPETYRPITTRTQAASLPVGEHIAISCGNCGGVTTLTVDKSRSYMKGFTCPMCKRTFRVISPGGGSKGADIYVLEDSYGKIAHLSASGKL